MTINTKRLIWSFKLEWRPYWTPGLLWNHKYILKSQSFNETQSVLPKTWILIEACWWRVNVQLNSVCAVWYFWHFYLQKTSLYMLNNLPFCFCISIIFSSVKYPQLLIAPCLSSLSTARSVSVRPVRAPTSGSSGGPSCRPSFWWPSVFGRWDTSRASLRQRNWCNCSPRGECKSVCVFVWVCVWCSTEWRQSLLSEETGRGEKQLQDSAWKHL